MKNCPHYTSDSYIPIPNISSGAPRGKKDKSKHNLKNQNRRPKPFRGIEKNIIDLEKEHALFPPRRKDLQEERYPQRKDLQEELYPPWRKKTAYSCGIIGLHEEIKDFYEFMHPTEKETEIRLKVVEHITRIVHSLWPQAKVEVFGSFRTGLFLPSSDIDMVVIGEWRNVPLSTLSNALQRNGIKDSDIDIIASANVPIVRLLHTPSRIRVDISFNMKNGVKGAKLIKNLIKEYPVLPQLVFVLKQYLVHRDLNEVYSGGMSSYCLTLLIVSLLQGHHKPKCLPSLNLGTLLLEFFEHYGINFNYERVSIHVQNGGNYRPRFGTGSYLSVEDPLVEGRDVAKGTYLMRQLKMAFQNSYYVLSQFVLGSANQKAPQISFLDRILEVSDEILKSRQWRNENCTNINRKLSQLLENVSRSHSNEPASKSVQDSNQFRKTKRKKF